MDIIKSLKNIISKKEFKSQLIDLIFKEVKNKEEVEIINIFKFQIQ